MKFSLLLPLPHQDWRLLPPWRLRLDICMILLQWLMPRRVCLTDTCCWRNLFKRHSICHSLFIFFFKVVARISCAWNSPPLPVDSIAQQVERRTTFFSRLRQCQIIMKISLPFPSDPLINDLTQGLSASNSLFHFVLFHHHLRRGQLIRLFS